MQFTALGLKPPLVHAIRDLGYTEATSIQAQAIPPALAGRDLIATAQTGSGKTVAFMLPLLNRMLDLPRGHIQQLVITPTRELAQQIETVGRGLSRYTNLRAGLVVGGAAMGPQEQALRDGVETIVATPGRLLDLMRTYQSRFTRLVALVLDEADRMLDMGFLPDIKRIVAKLPTKRQTLLFSATMPPAIEELAQALLKKPVSIQIGRRTAPAVGITQAAYPVAEQQKPALLQHLLRRMDMPSVLIFTRTKRSAKKLTRMIAADGFTVAELHSNRTQAQRTKALEGFRRGGFQVLVATNIAARGIDVEGITHVISFDVPDVPEDYVHRIGRTARAKAEGDAFILVAPEEEASFRAIERQIGQQLPRVTLPDFEYLRPGQAQPRGQERRPLARPAAHPPRRPHAPPPASYGRPAKRGQPHRRRR